MNHSVRGVGDCRSGRRQVSAEDGSDLEPPVSTFGLNWYDAIVRILSWHLTTSSQKSERSTTACDKPRRDGHPITAFNLPMA